MMPLQRIAAVIVTYNNPGMLKALLSDLQGQSRRPDTVIVIDNSTGCGAEEAVKNSPLALSYCRMAGNTGSAGGYAEGIMRGCEGHDAVWLLDDDVRAAPDALERLLEGFSRLPQTGATGAVRSWSSEQCFFTGARRMVNFCWRGTLIPTYAVRTVGLPRREFFLYGEDQEYSLRLQRKGFSIYWIAESRVIERRHEDKQRLAFLGASAVVYRDPARLYYAFRNSARTYILYRMWGRLVRLVLFGAKVIILFLAAGQAGTGAVVSAVAAGLGDGCRAKMGVCARYA